MPLIVEKSPSSLQDTTIPSQPTSLKSMKIDIPKAFENVEQPTTLTIVELRQLVSSFIPILVTPPLTES
jgi:hypothetical protein